MKGCDNMAIKRQRKISWYKVARLIVTIMFVAVAGLYCYNEHNQIPVGVISQEEALGSESAQEMSAKHRAQLEAEADRKLHEKLAKEAKQKSLAEQEAKLQAQQAAQKARSEKERAEFIEHRRDPSWTVVTQ